jgi:hypothetical protein
MLKCKYCEKECKNQNSLRNHERLCKLNPNKSISYFTLYNKIQNRNRSNQYIKAKLLELPKPEVSIEIRQKQSEWNRSRSIEWNKENGKRISKIINEKVAKGEWHTSLAKHMHYTYKGVDLHGKWELQYAMFLDENFIPWIRNKESFSYTYQDKLRKYTPDFYLPETNEYIEIKGYKTEKDDAKWSQFPSNRKLVILMKKELETLLKIKLK